MTAAPETRLDDDSSVATLAATARADDYDRYLTVLFAPPEARPALLALIALNLELARVRDVVAEPMIGQIRLQWWRDAVAEALNGAPRNHHVLTAIAAARGRIDRALLDEMMDAREVELGEPPATREEFERYATGSSGALAEAMAEALGADEGTRRAARGVGAAFGMIGVLRSVRWSAERGRILLPADVLAQSGASAEALKGLRPDPALAEAARRVVEAARARLARARAEDARNARALLLAPLTDAYMRRLANANYDLLGADLSLTPVRKQLAIAWAAFTGRY